MVTNASLQLQTFAPFIDSLVNNSLLQPMPHFNQLLLQFTDIMDLLLIHAVLHCFPNLVINRIEVLAIRRPQIWWDEFWGLMCNQLNSVSLAMLAGALSFWNMKKYPDTSWMAVSVAFPIYLNTGIHKNELCITEFGCANRNHDGQTEWCACTEHAFLRNLLLLCWRWYVQQVILEPQWIHFHR